MWLEIQAISQQLVIKTQRPVTYSEFNSLARELAFLAMWLTRPTSFTRLSNVERGQRLDGWPADMLQIDHRSLTMTRTIYEISIKLLMAFLCATSWVSWYSEMTGPEMTWVERGPWRNFSELSTVAELSRFYKQNRKSWVWQEKMHCCWRCKSVYR